MLLSFNELLSFQVAVEDGRLGKLTDILLSDDTWTVRYLLAGPGQALEGEPVLLSPMAVGAVDRQEKLVKVHLTLDRVKHAPRVDAKKPVSRHYEERYYDYYGWPYYWAGGPIWGPYFTPGELARAEARTIHQAGGQVPAPEHPHLRSAEEIATYRLRGSDDHELGPIEDLVIDDQTYRVKYVEIRTRKWLPGGKFVLLPTERIRNVSWAEKRILADVSRDLVKSAPERDRSEPLGELDEHPLQTHYQAAGRETMRT